MGAIGHIRDIYADNKLALGAILHPKPGPSQVWAVKTCEYVWKFLKENSQCQIWLRWCPGHLDIEMNERVDKAAKEGSKKLQPKYTSFAYARQISSQKAETVWCTQCMLKPEYTGHSWFRINKSIKVMSNRHPDKPIIDVHDGRFNE